MNILLQPWLQNFQIDLCAAVLETVANGNNAITLLNTVLNKKVCVPHANLPLNIAYEQFIYDTNQIPTRTSADSSGALHDACNALMWVHYPHSKAVLNELQANDIKTHGVQGNRSAVRDALTLFDENALILAYPANDFTPQQLANRQWADLLYHRRNEWHYTLKPYLFGHALLQKLQHPYLAITAHTWLLPYQHIDEISNLNAVDCLLAKHLSAAYINQKMFTRSFLPLPVLGIPRWCTDNTLIDFYQNTSVFRPIPNSF
jgi:hypothetical protein